MKLNQIDLNKLNTFFAVIEHGGVTAAARALALTPSAVSQSLSGLEDALDLRLFDRVGRRLVPTREGELLRRRFGSYQERLRETLDEILNVEREVRGEIRLGLYVGFPRPRLVDFLARFSADHPRASLRLLYGTREELEEAVLENRLDAVFSFASGEEDRRLQSTALFEQELVLVGSRAHEPKTLADLGTTPIIDYYRGDPLIRRWVAHHHPRKRVPQLPVRIFAASANLVQELVKQRVGVGVLPRVLVDPDLARGRLRLIRGERAELRDVIWMVERAGAWRGATLEAFRSAALASFSES